jgi:hypothetical protein
MGKPITDRVPAQEAEDLMAKFKKTHDTIDRPEKFAVMFCSVAESQTAVRQKLVSILQTSIQHDVETRQEVKKILLEIYNEDWKSFVRSAIGKVAILAWTAISLVIGAVINNYLG